MLTNLSVSMRRKVLNSNDAAQNHNIVMGSIRHFGDEI